LTAIGRHRKGTATASEASPKARNRLREVAAPEAAPTAAWTRQAISITLGSRAPESMALTGAGASLWASGSQ